VCVYIHILKDSAGDPWKRKTGMHNYKCLVSIFCD